MGYNLRPYQDKAVEKCLESFRNRNKSFLIVSPTGCHAKGEKVLMYDGSIKNVENVVVGDKLMGSDGFSRNVLHLTSGEDNLYKIIPTKGDLFVVNEGHILTLVKTRNRVVPRRPCEIYDDSLVDISVKDYLKLSDWKKHLLKLVHTEEIEFEYGQRGKISVPPYFLGIILGDGLFRNNTISVTTMDKPMVDVIKEMGNKYGFDYRTEPAGKAKTYIFRNKSKEICGATRLKRELKELGLKEKKSGDKFVPQVYKMAPVNIRKEILAGLMDSDGYINTGCYDYVSKSKVLAEDVCFIARSLGLRAKITECEKEILSRNFSGTYYRVTLSGNLNKIPCKVKKVGIRKQKKNPLRSGFRVERIGKGEYYGFTVDKDNRYLLPDFTITHNCGKTVMMSAIVDRIVKNGGKVLFLAHRNMLVEQGQSKVKNEDGVTYSTVQSMSRDDVLNSYDRDAFNLIVVDEVHHILSPTYQKIINYFGPRTRVLGVTATPVRGDGKDVGNYFSEVHETISLQDAIKEGYLSPLKVQTCPVSIDVSNVNLQGGDYSAGEVGEALKPYLAEVTRQIIEKAGNRKTIIFTPLVSTAQGMAEMFNSLGAKADYVAGDRKETPDILSDYHDGKFQFLVNSMLATEGYDEPGISCVVNLRLTKSEALMTQILGRGTRLCPEEGKKDCLILDFLWRDKEKRKRLSPVAVLASQDKSEDDFMYEDTVASLADAVYDVPVDLSDALEDGKAHAKAVREAALARALRDAKAKEALEKRQEEERAKAAVSFDEIADVLSGAGTYESVNGKLKVCKEARYTSVKVDDAVFKELGIDSFLTRSPYHDPVSEGQVKMLQNLRVPLELVYDKNHASYILDELLSRQKAGLASYGQIKTLLRYKVENPAGLKAKDAKKGIDIIIKNKWKPSNEAFAYLRDAERDDR